MLRRALPLVAVALAAAGCGSTTSGPATVSTAETRPATETRAPAASVIAYYLRDGKVAPVRTRIEQTKAVATAALTALLEGPPAGYDTAVPAGLRLESLTIDAGVAHARLSAGVDATAAAQIVYTLTQFPSVTGVALQPAFGSGEPLTRAEFEEATPMILVESPLPGDEVSSPIGVTGTANTFEANFQLELRQGDRVLAKTHVTATSGSGERGTFEHELAYEGSGDAVLVATQPTAASPGEGPPELGRVEIPVTLR